MTPDEIKAEKAKFRRDMRAKAYEFVDICKRVGESMPADEPDDSGMATLTTLVAAGFATLIGQIATLTEDAQ